MTEDHGKPGTEENGHGETTGQHILANIEDFQAHAKKWSWLLGGILSLVVFMVGAAVAFVIYLKDGYASSKALDEVKAQVAAERDAGTNFRITVTSTLAVHGEQLREIARRTGAREVVAPPPEILYGPAPKGGRP